MDGALGVGEVGGGKDSLLEGQVGGAVDELDVVEGGEAASQTLLAIGDHELLLGLVVGLERQGGVKYFSADSSCYRVGGCDHKL